MGLLRVWVWEGLNVFYGGPEGVLGALRGLLGVWGGPEGVLGGYWGSWGGVLMLCPPPR